MLESSLTPETNIQAFIANNPLFYSLPGEVIESIVEKVQERTYGVGEAIFEEGKLGDSFYIVRKGQVRVTKVQGGEEMVLSELGEGEGFGEMALLIDQPRTATVKALSEVNLLVLNREDFTVLTRSLPALAEKMNKLLTGEYMPSPVRRVDMPKPQGRVRTLGIPTLTDRMIQQALHQVLSPIFEAASRQESGSWQASPVFWRIRSNSRSMWPRVRWLSVTVNSAAFFRKPGSYARAIAGDYPRRDVSTIEA